MRSDFSLTIVWVSNKESVVTKLSTKIARAAKRVTSLISAAAIAAVGLVASVAAPAQAAPVTKPQYVNIVRTTSQDGSITIHNGETLRVTVSLNGSITSDGVKQITTNAVINQGVTALTYGATSYRWEFNGCMGAQMSALTLTATPCASATGMSIYVNQNITNSSGSDQLITSNSSTATITYGDSTLATSNPQFYASRNPSSSELSNGITYVSGDNFMSGSIQLCFNSSLVSANDELTWDVSVLNGTTPVSNEFSMMNFDPYVEVTYNDMMGSVPAVTGRTYTINSSVISSGLNMNINSGRLSAGTYHFSVDLKKNGASVLSTCSMVGPGGPVSLLTGALGSAAGVANAVIAEKSLGSNITTSDRGAFGEDGQGGFIVVSPAVAEGSFTVANLTATGPKANFGGSGKITVTPADPESMLDGTGWFGAAQTGWAASFSGMEDTEVFWGLKANATVKRKVITASALSTFCTTNAAGYSIGHVGGMMQSPLLSAPTADPMMFVNCFNMQTQGEKNFVVKLTTAGITKVVSASWPTPTDAKPCTSVSTFVNAAATTTKVAVIMIIASKAKASMGMSQPSCYSNGEIGDRRITTITAAGVAKVGTTNIPTSVIPANASVALAPSSTTGAWVGVVRSGVPAKPTSTIKITATGSVSKWKSITLDAASAFPQASYFVPVKQLVNGTIIGLRTLTVPGMTTSYKYAVAKIDSNGKVTTGKVLTVTAASMMDTWSAKNLSGLSISAAGVVNYYFVSKYTETANGNKIKVVTWTNPRS